ncbi:hypothetical protein CAC42_1876 [Sphaceloma murrayae]|uniref:Chromatin remodeling factor mit1 n=1 Tax=Sphaceloma murrayae TaxID=2082308 RepID=A0A2K1QW11_9PEZI|nr:hypothetical protein CAC42_1876 [Sphaceloma murrayae]
MAQLAGDLSSEDDLAMDLGTWNSGKEQRTVQAARVGAVHTGTPLQAAREDGIEEEIHVSSFVAVNQARKKQKPLLNFRIHIPKDEVEDPSEYEDYTHQATIVREVTGMSKPKGSEATCHVIFEDTHTGQISVSALLQLDGGKDAYDAFKASFDAIEKDGDFSEEGDYGMSSTRPSAKRQKREDYADLEALNAAIDSSASDERPNAKRPRLLLNSRRDDVSEDELSGAISLRRSQHRSPSVQDFGRRTRQSVRQASSPQGSSEAGTEASDSSADIGFLTSDINPKRPSRALGTRAKRKSHVDAQGTVFDKAPKSTRQSGRSGRHQGTMQEIGEDKIHRSDSDRPAPAPKAVGIKEKFRPLPRTDPFRNRHMQHCDTCSQGSNFAPLIYCQGCTFAYHKSCIRDRSTREHLVTKVGDEDFVLQCRRCIRIVQRKEPTAPDQSKCSDCKLPGPACKAFRTRLTTAMEQKERELNGGVDPIIPVSPHLINNPAVVMFRCVGCFRAHHFEHLPPRTSDVMATDHDSVAALRFAEYSKDWKCQECESAPAKVKGLIAWKPVEEDSYDPTKSIDEISEDEKVYLVRWEGMSYFKANWMPGPWVWGATTAAMRKAFAKRDDSQVPKMRTEDAIPEEFLRADIVLEVKYTSYVDVNAEEIDKARIREVKEALIKFKGLTYEDAVWEKPPVPEDEERWTDFVTAYNDFIMGLYVRQPKAQPLKARLEKVRNKDFATLEKKKQPDMLVGGELMKYQLEGVNWLYYKWYSQKNAILADEMGLGKTIQIIGFMSTLVSEHNTFPFLVVVPNATCANWRREIKHWAPGLKVVAWFGSHAARDMAQRYELFPRGAKELRAHVVVTSYDAAQDDNCKRFFRSVPWQGLIVDEGQRLKSDKTNLYGALLTLKVPFRILLTGTPLQNNARELFNLLQFLDQSYKAADMELAYEDLDNQKIIKLHETIRPFFLRRTKAQVLTFLPPMAQIIVPVSMSLVQKKLYRSILAKNPDLLRALFAEKRDLRGSEKGSLNNILMQLRKCLCHPFVYNKGIEERNVSHSISHRNLVEASGKLQLLEVLLPKLKERGHRVLIFSQFLDMLTMVEDFLDGLGMMYHRLDGTMSSLQKQRRIDDFNAPQSEYFAFLLSTRAGGVGINLATADTVIILDPDFNPHQDIQALSRAHRIGQKRKVLCFQLVTRASAEEKIIQIGRRKMALDHILIESMDAEDAPDQDLQSILRHGASEIFSDDGDKDIKYDAAEIDKLLDRTQMENTQSGEDKSAESQFSFARVWANDGLEETLQLAEAEDVAPDPGVWDKILKERERAAAAEAAAAKEAFGRGRRAKQTVDYRTAEQDAQQAGLNAEEAKIIFKAKHQDSDTDFQAESDAESAHDEEPDPNTVNTAELQNATKRKNPTPKIGEGKKLFFTTSFKARKHDFASLVNQYKVSPKKHSRRGAKGRPKNAAPAKAAGRKKKDPLSAAVNRISTPAKSIKGVQRKGMKATSLPTPASSPMFVDLDREGSAPASHMKEPILMPNRLTPSLDAVIDLTGDAVFRRVHVPQPLRNYHGLPTPPSNDQPLYFPQASLAGGRPGPQLSSCIACFAIHPLGSCPLKTAGVEKCNLCGIAHFGHGRICPHINSETQVRAMLDALKQSPEAGHLVKEARKYLTGVKGTLVQKKKMEEEKRQRERSGRMGTAEGQAMGQGGQGMGPGVSGV